MAVGRTVVKNTLYLISAQGATSALAFVQAVILVRYLGTESYGVWSVAQAWPGILHVLTDMGLNSYILREIAADRGRLGFYFLNALLIKLVMAAVFLGVVWSASRMLGYGPQVGFYIFLAAAAQAVASLELLFLALFRAIQCFVYESIIGAAKAVGLLAVVVLVVHKGLGIKEILYGSLVWEVALVAGCFALLLGHWRPARERLLGPVGSVKLVVRASPFALLTFIMPIFYQIDIVMLSKLASMEAVGIYSAAYKLVVTLILIPRAFKNALFPTLSRLHATSREQFEAVFSFACKAMALVGFPLAFLIFAQAGRIITFLYANRFAESVLPLKIMAFCLLFTYLYSTTQAALDASHNEARSALVWLAATVSNVVVDLILIPRYGYVGSAMATLLSEMTVFAGGYIVLRRRLSLRLGGALLLKVGGLAALTALLVSVLKLHLLLLAAAAVLIYPALVFFAGIFSRQELKMLFARGES